MPQRESGRPGMMPPRFELEMVLSSGLEDIDMTDNSFPYVLICSTFTTILSLASVWVFTAHSFAPALVA